MIAPISKSQSARVSRTSVRPRGALERAVWREAAMTCQAACATSLHGCWVEAGPESSQASSSRQGRSRRGRFPASQALGGRPSGPPSPPSPRVAWKSLRGPRSNRTRLHYAGLRLASVPETATAWQQRAPGAVAINYLPAAAAVRQPTAPRCKYAALSAPAHPAPPPARVEAPNVHRPFSSIEYIPRHHLKVGKTITTKIKQTKRTRAQNGRVISLSQEATGTNLAEVHLGQISSAPPLSFKPTPDAPSAPPPRRLHSSLSGEFSLGRWGARSPDIPLRRGGWGGGCPPIAQTRFVSFLQP